MRGLDAGGRVVGGIGRRMRGARLLVGPQTARRGPWGMYWKAGAVQHCERGPLRRWAVLARMCWVGSLSMKRGDLLLTYYAGRITFHYSDPPWWLAGLASCTNHTTSSVRVHHGGRRGRDLTWHRGRRIEHIEPVLCCRKDGGRRRRRR